jgi:alpha-glucosidase (family GH31 glycosyl hydrolase)
MLLPGLAGCNDSRSGTAPADNSTFAALPGPQGAPGEKGPSGDKGEAGDKGATGDTGATGIAGATGEKGAKGDPGEKGAKGDKGSEGDKGETGDKGLAGDSGGTTDAGSVKLVLPVDGTITPVPGGFDVQLKSNVLGFRAAASNALRIQFRPNGASSAPTMVIDPAFKSDAVFELIPDANGSGTTLKTAAFSAHWDTTLRRVVVADAAGQTLMSVRSEDLRSGKLVVRHNPADTLYGINGSGRLLTSYGTDASDWESASGIIRDYEESLQTGVQGHAGAPFVWSTSGYGVLADTLGAIGRKIELRYNDRIEFSDTSKKDIDAYLLVGQPKELFGAVAKISGPTPLFPRWAMGFMNSAWGADNQWNGYNDAVGMTEAKLKNIIQGYRAVYPTDSPVPVNVRDPNRFNARVPLDAFILDLDWMNWANNAIPYSQFNWNANKFPSAASGELKTWMGGQGVSMVGILKPRLPVASEEGYFLKDNDYWMPNTPIVQDYFRKTTQMRHLDFGKPKVRAWYFEQLKGAFDKGLVGWWNDEADASHATDGGNETEGPDMQRAVYEGQRAYSNLRVFSINRNFYLGAQRYAYGLWSGDIDNGFASMAEQRQRMLSAVNAGAMQWTMDTGGFRKRTEKVHGKDVAIGTGVEDYARWLQFAVFTPIMRVHADNGDQRQPWFYVPPGQNLGNSAAVEAIRLRYKLIPYIYSYEHQRRKTGVGIVRPLIFDWPQDQNVRNSVDSWLFGDWLLASPVVVQGQKSKDIYLPAGTWTRWNSGQVNEGGQLTSFNTLAWEKNFPLFIRQGAIIPTMNDADSDPVSADYVTSVGNWHPKELNVEVFPDTKRTTFDYYDDDGTTYDYEKGAYFLQTLSVQRTGKTVQFDIAAPDAAGTFKPKLEYYTVKIYGDMPASVVVNGKKLEPVANTTSLSGNMEGWLAGTDWSRSNSKVTFVRLKAQTEQKVVLTLQ